MPIAVILRFKGEPNELADAFERALGSAAATNGDGLTEPLFFAVAKSDDGIVVMSGWAEEDDHKAFRKRLMPHLSSAGITRPVAHEQFEVARLGWNFDR